MKLTLRYLVMHSQGPDDNVEEKIWPVEEAHELELARSALVLVDTWNKHPLKSHLEATDRVTRERIAPLLAPARAAGIPVIYAPSPDVAPRYEQWQRRFGGRPRPPSRPRPTWSTELRRRPGETWPDWDGSFPWDAIAEPIAPEPDDCVVATGEELHELLGERGVTFLLYAGFATNICVLHRDYGVLAMGARGYLPILLRDCTVGIETRDTLDGMLATRMAIHDVERRYYTADSAELLAALRSGR